MNSRTNLAYDHSLDIEYPVSVPRTSSNVRIKVHKKSSTAATRKLRTQAIFRIVLVALLAFTVLYRGLMITDKNTDIANKQDELAALIASNQKLQVDIDRALDLDKVEVIAQTELGMRQAEKHQTVYINLEQTDYVEKVAGQNLNAGVKIADFFRSVMAYFA